MKKPRIRLPKIRRAAIVPFLLGGLVAAGGLKGYEYVYGSGGGATLLQQLQGDSATVAAAPAGASATPGTALPDSLPSMVVDTLPPAVDTAGAPLAATAAGAVPVYGNALSTDTLAGGDRLPERRLAKMFGSMQAREAARVLENMSDGEVEVILAQLGDREAASILSNLSPERAAQISQVVISGERSSP